jgi:hypothetical protein
MTCYCQGSEGAKESAVMKCDQAERNDNEKDSLLVDMPAEQERGVPTQGDRANKGLPLWFVQ